MGIKEQISLAENGLLVRAPGKVNLCLLIAGKRADGYHDIESVMAKVDWYDEILIEAGKSEGIELICRGPEWSPEGEENLVYKAAKLILDTAKDDLVCIAQPTNFTGWKPAPQIKITLTKNVPAGAGLGSGSSDAAATLIGINEYFKLGLSREKLAESGASIGSDVAFFLGGPMSLCTGRGEKIKKLGECEFRAFLILPDISVSTAKVYANYRHDAGQYERFHKELTNLIEKNRIDLVCKMCANMLQESCFELHTKLKEYKNKVESLGIRQLCLSGSGSSMFCIIDKSNEERIRTCQNNLEREFGLKSIIVSNNRW